MPSSGRTFSATSRRSSPSTRRYVDHEGKWQGADTLQKEGIKIKTLEKCDFKPMYEYFESEREKKKAMSREEKKA